MFCFISVTYPFPSAQNTLPLCRERDKLFSIQQLREKKRWSPSSSHSSLLDQYWSAGRAAAAAGRFTPAFYHDDRGVWPAQRLKASQLAGSSIICSARHDGRWDTLMDQSSGTPAWTSPPVGCWRSSWLCWVCWTCGQINMSDTFYSSHMLRPDWTLGRFTASTTETKLSFNITEDLWTLPTSLISSVYSVSCFMASVSHCGPDVDLRFCWRRHIISLWRLLAQQTSAG